MDYKQFMTVFLIAALSAPFLSVFVTPVFCFLRKMFFLPFIREKLLDSAIKKGNIVQAKLIKQYDVINSTKEAGIYTYEFKGKKYKYRCNSYTRLPEQVELYFLKNPRKACPSHELGLRESNWLRYFLIISLAIGVIIFIWGAGYVKK